MRKLFKKNNIVLFISIFVLLFFVHLPLMYKNIITSDVLLNNHFYNGYSWEISLGRFGLYIVGILKSFISVNHIELFISFALISFSTILLIDLFNIDNIYTKILCIVFFSVSPIISATLLFHYCSVAYFISFFSGVFSIYLFYKAKNKYLKYIVPFILVIISLSMYQAYFSFIVSLFVFYNLYLIIRNKVDYIDSFKYLCIFLLGVITYFILMKLSLFVFHIDMSSYSNADGIGISTILNIPSKFIDSYILFYKFFYTDSFMKNNFLHNNIINTIILITFIISYILYMYHNKTSKINIIISLIILLLLPVFLNSVIFVISDSKLQLLMSASYLLLFFFIILISNNKYIKYIIYISFILLFRNYLVQDQATYMSLENTFNRYNTIIGTTISSNINNLDKNFVILGNINLKKDLDMSKIYDYNYGYISDDGIFWEEYNLRKIAFERFVYEYYGLNVSFADEDIYNYILSNRNTNDIVYEIDDVIVIDFYNC